MRAYSMDLRQRVLADCDAGLTTLATARRPPAELMEP